MESNYAKSSCSLYNPLKIRELYIYCLRPYTAGIVIGPTKKGKRYETGTETCCQSPLHSNDR